MLMGYGCLIASCGVISKVFVVAIFFLFFFLSVFVISLCDPVTKLSARAAAAMGCESKYPVVRALLIPDGSFASFWTPALSVKITMLAVQPVSWACHCHNVRRFIDLKPVISLLFIVKVTCMQ